MIPPRRPGRLGGFPFCTPRLLPLAALLSACATTPPVAEEATAGDAVVARAEPAPAAAPASASGLPAPPGEGPQDAAPEPYLERALEAESPPAPENLWQRIATGLRLQQHYDLPEVGEQMRLYAKQSDYFGQVGERARPFLHNIVQQIEQRAMPMEIALIPFVESGFNPYARSSRSAAGPWQFMAGTGRSLGLRVDEWFDGRRDPILATTAALDYLEIQHQRFEGNWLLAFAAYNSGPATVSRALRSLDANPRDVDYRDLPLPAETRTHVPRILALANMLANAGGAEVELPDIADEVALERVKIGAGASLVLAAELAGLEPDALRGLNPGFRQWWTPPEGGPDFLHLPRNNAAALRLALRESPDSIQLSAVRYLIEPGDTLGGIARAMSVPVDVLRSRNGLEGDLIVAGEYLWIPGLGPGALDPLDVMVPRERATLDSTTPAVHIVQPGDSLWTIARRYGLAVDKLARDNAIAPAATIFPGQQLTLDPAAGAATEIYRISRGDTLGRVAARFGQALDDILLWNSIEADELIFPGQLLRVAPPTDRPQ